MKRQFFGSEDIKTLKTLLLEALEIMGPLDDNAIDDIIAILHFKGKIDGGRIRLSQCGVYSTKWRAVMMELINEGLVEKKIRQNKTFYELDDGRKEKIEVKKFKDSLEEIKSISPKERWRLALNLFQQAANQ